jgi:thioredoxin reductase
MNTISRRDFAKLSVVMTSMTAFPRVSKALEQTELEMTDRKEFDVILVGGSFSGMAAAMALGRALRNVLIIDSGSPCNSVTPASHNFLTQDGKTPSDITAIARGQLSHYNTITFYVGTAESAIKTTEGFEVTVSGGMKYKAKKLIFATGIKDVLPEIKGLAACWGKTVLHCPYCHGYEVRFEPTGILGNGDYGFEFSALISNWTNELTLFTNGKSTLTNAQTKKLNTHSISIVEKEIAELEHLNGSLQRINFIDGTTSFIKALYTRVPFLQHCPIPQSLGAALTEEGYLKIDSLHKTTVEGVFACGDNTTRLRTVANAVSAGTTTGMMVNKELINETF